jgi:hypothetical protein
MIRKSETRRESRRRALGIAWRGLSTWEQRSDWGKKVEDIKSNVESPGETYPSLFLSIIDGTIAWTYVEVQMNRRMTRRSDWKLKIAV